MEGILLEAETGDYLGTHHGFWFYTIERHVTNVLSYAGMWLKKMFKIMWFSYQGITMRWIRGGEHFVLNR